MDSPSIKKKKREIHRWYAPNDLVMPVVEFDGPVRPLVDSCRRAKDCTIDGQWLTDMEKKAASYYVYLHNILKRHDQKKRVESSLMEVLTGAEQKLLLLICRGMTIKQIAEAQGKTVGSVKGMCRRMYAKIGAKGMADAVRIATEHEIEKKVTL